MWNKVSHPGFPFQVDEILNSGFNEILLSIRDRLPEDLNVWPQNAERNLKDSAHQAFRLPISLLFVPGMRDFSHLETRCCRGL